MSLEAQNPTTIPITASVPAENEMVQRDRWDEIRRLYCQERRRPTGTRRPTWSSGRWTSSRASLPRCRDGGRT